MFPDYPSYNIHCNYKANTSKYGNHKSLPFKKQ